jgi:hypothetical protein
MNDQQKLELFREMAERVNEQLEDASLESDDLAEVTEQLVRLIPNAGIQDEEATRQLYYGMAATVLRQL